MNPAAPAVASPPLLRVHAGEVVLSHHRLQCPEWTIRRGESWCLLGAPESGKTSLLRALAGIESPLTGRIEFDSADWARLRESASIEHRRRIGVVLDRGAALFHRATILENILLPLRYHAGSRSEEPERRCAELIAALDLERVAHRSGAHLHPAVARRALLARALALRPEVFVLDEPPVDFGDAERVWWVRLLTELNAGHALLDGRPLTLVLAACNVGIWRRLPGLKWALLHDGRLHVDLTPEQLVATAPELFQHPDAETTVP